MVSVRRINPRVITQTHRSLLRENRTSQRLETRVGCSSIRGVYCLRLKSGEQTDDADGEGGDGDDDGDNGAQNAARNQVVFDGHKCSLRTSEHCGAQVHSFWTLCCRTFRLTLPACIWENKKAYWASMKASITLTCCARWNISMFKAPVCKIGSIYDFYLGYIIRKEWLFVRY